MEKGYQTECDLSFRYDISTKQPWRMVKNVLTIRFDQYTNGILNIQIISENYFDKI